MSNPFRGFYFYLIGFLKADTSIRLLSMTDSDIKTEGLESGGATAVDTALVERLGRILEERGVPGENSLGIVFRYPDLKVVFVNPIGQKILSPIFEGGETSDDFALSDVISVESKRQYDAEVYPMLQVTGRWSGDIVLRDLWGGDIPTNTVFWNSSSKDDLAGKYLFVHSEPLSNPTFKNMRGWKDRELLLALLGHTKDAIYFKDKESRFLRASHCLIKRFGLKYPHEVIGKTDFHFFGVSHASAAYEDEQKVIRTGEPILDKEEREVWDDQSVTWAATTKLPLYDADGSIVGTYGISRDITKKKREEEERKELELRLQLAQRLEAIGSLAAGVAHEINTPTQFVSDNVKFLGDAFSDLSSILAASMALVDKSKGIQKLDAERKKVQKAMEEYDLEFLNEEIPQTIEQSLDGLRQTAKIVGAMKEFSYPSSPEKSKSDLNHAIENTLNVSCNEWKGIAEVDLELDPELPEVACMVDQINQVILNLIVNAAHAIDATESRQGRIGIKSKVEGASVCIEVSDTGTGMTDSVRSRIFDPFFTTKEVGKGTGQGLAMVRAVIVNTHCGTVECESELGKGTVFKVLLPIDANAE